jgi:hypothetical protein
MWYAVTANPISRSKKESKKEFHSRSRDIILSAESKSELETKIQDNMDKYPEQMTKYLVAGIKFVEAETAVQAKKRAKKVAIYFDKNGQYKFI